MEATRAVSVRRHDLDWLRVLGVLAVFTFHSMHFFDLEDWSVKNPVTHAWVAWPEGLVLLWMMPLIFVVSGASIYYATRKGRAGGFLKDKVLRLLVPLVVGVFTFSIGQVYLERLTHGQFHGSFFAFIPHYFEGVYLPGSTGNFAFHGMHLWYLLLLFVFTVVLAPLFFWLKGDKGRRAVSKLGDVLALPGGIALLALPTIALHAASGQGALSFGLGGWPLVQYLWFFLAGYLIVADERVQQRIVQARWAALGLAVAIYALSALLTSEPYRYLIAWPALFALLGFAGRHLTFRNPLLDYANEAVLPFYILHQNVLFLVGFFVVGRAVPDLAKFAIIASSSLVVIMVTYEFAVRRFTPVRVLFGMKPLRRPASMSPQPLAEPLG